MRTLRHFLRIRVTIRSTSSTDPLLASMLERLSFCRQQVPATEDVERQIAVAVVVAVEEPAFLVSVQRIIGGIQIENDLGRRLLVGVHEQVDEQSFDRPRVVADLVVARRLPDAAVLQPVERRLAGKHRTVLPLRRQAFRQEGQHRVVAQRVVVVDVLVAQRDRGDPLVRPASVRYAPCSPDRVGR